MTTRKFALRMIVAVLGALAVASCSLGSATDLPDKVIHQGTVGSDNFEPQMGEGWQLIWSDEFDGDRIDNSKWGFDVDCWGGGNNERQCYTDRSENSNVSDGKLVITARQERFSGPALPVHLRGSDRSEQSKPFTSARLTTRGKAFWRYGWIEVRAKLPKGQGTWPAIWMLPEKDTYGTWAASGEIDILEAVNLGVACEECPGGVENTVLGTLHFGSEWPDNKLNSTEVALPGSIDEFHTFAVVWSEGKFVWLVDGRIFAVKEAADWSTGGSDDPNAPFDQPFHLVLNLAIGGGLPEERGLGGVSDAGFPKQLEIDWVKVWQCDNVNARQGSCSL